MNSGTARRSLWAPAGDVTVPAVADGNMFMARRVYYEFNAVLVTIVPMYVFITKAVRLICFACCAGQHCCASLLPGRMRSLWWNLWLLLSCRFTLGGCMCGAA